MKAGDSVRKVITVQRSRGFRSLDPQELWAYRSLFLALLRRDLALRYRQTLLGIAWVVARPLLTILVLAAVFGRIVRVPSGGVPYPAFVLAGYIPWSFFAQSLTATTSSVVGSGHLLTKVYFPRLILPLTTIAGGIPDLLVATAVMVALLHYYGLGLRASLLGLPLVGAAMLLVTTAVGILVAAMNVAYRDVGQVIPFVVQLWLYASPVIYPSTLVPRAFRHLLYVNPMTGVIEASRGAFLGTPVDASALMASLGISTILLLVALDFFRRVDARVADIV